MTLRFIDISNHQAGLKLANTDAQAAIMKAVEGTTYVDPYCSGFVEQARKLDMPFGVYAFFRGSGVAEAKFFLENVSGWIGKGVLALDWENGASSHAEAKKFLDYVKDQTGVTPWVYIPKSYLSSAGDIEKAGYPLWIADPSGGSSYGSVSPWDKAIAWQYSWSHSTGGQKVDADYFYGTAADWAKHASGKSSGASDSSGGDGGGTTTEPVYPTRCSITTPYGKKGDWASGYHQGDDWSCGEGNAEIGDKIYSVADGVIIYAADARNDGGGGWGSAFGIHVLNQWDEHGRTSIDAHMSKLHVKKGDRVKVGDLIGEKGATGNVTGPHDHHEQHTGTRWTDPDVKPIYPGQTVPTPAGGDDFDMADHVVKARTDAQGINHTDIEQWLKISNDGDVSLVDYPCHVIGGIIDITVSGLRASDDLLIYPGAYDVNTKKKNSDGENDWKAVSTDKSHPVRLVGAESGWVRTRIPFDWVLGDQASGYSYRGLRFRMQSSNYQAAVEYVSVSGWIVKV